MVFQKLAKFDFLLSKTTLLGLDVFLLLFARLMDYNSSVFTDYLCFYCLNVII